MATTTAERLSMSQEEAARAIGVTPRTLRNWERRGLIRGNRVAGGRKLYPVDALRRLATGETGTEVRDGQPE